ncbi:MAG: hypothetical protein OQK82_08450 [Candidatus Pacearchaeota archaeon]|nr:hypothetical protein [Candidatus Pacearchaeota archaeon]
MTLEQISTNNEIHIEEILPKERNIYFPKGLEKSVHPNYFRIIVDKQEYLIAIDTTENLYENENHNGFEVIEDDGNKHQFEFNDHFQILQIKPHNTNKLPKSIEYLIRKKIHEAANL